MAEQATLSVPEHSFTTGDHYIPRWACLFGGWRRSAGWWQYSPCDKHSADDNNVGEHSVPLNDVVVTVTPFAYRRPLLEADITAALSFRQASRCIPRLPGDEQRAIALIQSLGVRELFSVYHSHSGRWARWPDRPARQCSVPLV